MLHYSYFNSKGDPVFCADISQKYHAILQKNEDFTFGRIFSEAMFKGNKVNVSINMLPENLIPLVACYFICKQVIDSIAGRTSASSEQAELLCRLVPADSHPALRLLIHINMCTGYFYMNDSSAYSYHLEQALNIALPRKWYYPFAAYSYPNSWIEIKELDEEAYNEIRKLSDFIIGNYISNGYFKSNLTASGKISATILRVAILVSRGMSNTAIANRLGVTLYEVKKCIKQIYADTGLNDREELAEFVRFHLKIV